MTYYFLKFIGLDEDWRVAYGNCIMTETDLQAYKSEVYNFFSKPGFKFYMGNGHTMRYTCEKKFWENITITPISDLQRDLLISLDIANFGDFPNIECFMKE